MDSDLIKAYTETDYHILPFELIVKIGERNNRLEIEMKKQSWKNFVIMTAWNPRSVRTEHEENLTQNLKLLKDLIEEDFIVHPALGKSKEYYWTPEESWCIFNIPKKRAINLGIKYNQNAIVYGETYKAAELVYCFDD